MRKTRQIISCFASRLLKCFVAWLFIVSPSVHADSVELVALKDTTLYEPENINDDAGNGSGENIFAGKNKNGLIRRAVIAFDIAAEIPAGATIDSVQLILTVSNVPNPLVNATTSLHRLDSDWGKGESDAGVPGGEGTDPAEDDATWRHAFYPDTLWVTLGGDFAPGASASIPVGDVGTYTWGSTAGMVAEVQQWLDQPATNFGWVIIGDESKNKTAKRLDSRESIGAGRPSLVVNYTTAVPVGSCCTGASCQVISEDACIALEGDLLEAPVSGMDTLTMGPGERYDVIIDFSAYSPGDEIFLENSAPAPFPGGQVNLTQIMKFIVVEGAAHTDSIPVFLRPVVPIEPAEAEISRNFVLRKAADDGCGRQNWLINDLGWDDITEYPVLDTVEIWRFINDSGVSHPMHMHLVFFQILDRQAFTLGEGDEIIPLGEPQPPGAFEAGWKDTAMVHPGEMVRVIARFQDYAGKYAYHCHILEHEDHEMMRQFQTIVPGCTPSGDDESVCDGIDNDCDGIVDEDCLIFLNGFEDL
ncbi:multicopper oxidase domain-containing protein [Pseudomonadota bacterium]